MYLVAIAELNGTPQAAELSALAGEIGTTAYDLRLVLNAGLPAVVVVTRDEAVARAAAAAVARRGYPHVFCDRSAIIPSAQLTALRQFELTSSELIADRSSGEAVRFTDLTVLVRAVHRSSQHTVEQVKERKLRPVMAVATGGLVMSKQVTKEVTTTISTRDQVLYLFRRGSPHPWILRERGANYATLGAAMGRSSFENFTKTIARLRELAPTAVYDERLVNSRPIRGIGDGSDAVDILAYMIATHAGR